MREIKFRAWVVSEKRMITDTQEFIPLIVTNKGVMKLQPQFKENYYEILPSDWFELMQSTGLKDKNGVEIYEGDIVKQTFYKIIGDDDYGMEEINGYEIGEIKIISSKGVCMKNPIRHVEVNGEVKKDAEKTRMYKNIVSYRCEVIGNIHEKGENNA